MSVRPLPPIVHALSLGAGSLDALTGCGLVFAPAVVLALMRVPPAPAEALVFVRFVGAFVAAIGFAYWRGWLEWRRHGSPSLLSATWRITALVRFLVGAYVVVACSCGWLSPRWLTVAATDWALAVVQLSVLAKGGFHAS